MVPVVLILMIRSGFDIRAMPEVRLIYPDHTFNFSVNSFGYGYGKKSAAVNLSNLGQILSLKLCRVIDYCIIHM